MKIAELGITPSAFLLLKKITLPGFWLRYQMGLYDVINQY